MTGLKFITKLSLSGPKTTLVYRLSASFILYLTKYWSNGKDKFGESSLPLTAPIVPPYSLYVVFSISVFPSTSNILPSNLPITFDICSSASKKPIWNPDPNVLYLLTARFDCIPPWTFAALSYSSSTNNWSFPNTSCIVNVSGASFAVWSTFTLSLEVNNISILTLSTHNSPKPPLLPTTYNDEFVYKPKLPSEGITKSTWASSHSASSKHSIYSLNLVSTEPSAFLVATSVHCSCVADLPSELISPSPWNCQPNKPPHWNFPFGDVVLSFFISS